MLSINTNLSSLITQNSMKTSTDKLNQAIEKMTTGFKINHAKDNAANYSISTNLTTQLSAYDTAADNVAMGMDLVNYASDIISQMQDKAARLNALSTQARNGTYGAQSLSALNSEASAIMSELMRLYSTAEYNDISLFNRTAYTIAPHLPQAGASGFIDETAVPTNNGEYGDFLVDPKHPNGDAYVDGLTSVTEAIAAGSLTSGGEYKVGGVDDLKALATYVNSGSNTSGMTFIMSEDIDLSGEANWTPIGYFNSSIDSNSFKGTFDGNGHVIKNLKIDRETSDYQGLFGYAQDGEIKNIGLENVDIKGKSRVGGLAGDADSSDISNSYSTGNVNGTYNVGGLVGQTSNSSTISDSYATGDVSGTGICVGGLVGEARNNISNSYATGNVTGLTSVGGLAGTVSANIENCYATGEVIGTVQFIGGLVGCVNGNIANSYAKTTVKTSETSTRVGDIGGLAGQVYNGIIENCYAEGIILSTAPTTALLCGQGIGGLAGNIQNSSVNNSYSEMEITGLNNIGGLVGNAYSVFGETNTISNSVSYSKINCEDKTTAGSLVALATMTDNGTDFGTLNIVNCKSIEQEGMNSVGGAYQFNGMSSYDILASYDLSPILAGITGVTITDTSTNLQVGIYSNDSSRINFNTNFEFEFDLKGGIESEEVFNSILKFENLLSEKATQFGAIQNRLDSALESIEVNINNLTSTRSTIRDADIAEVSSQYIQQQILQQAAATLMATANQSPSIALQLI